ncbi:MAG: hypothetical protein IPM98_17715 [Lewinellaceae bacterium]|nr:hypothetical protein [Lewinellaceae bacterium]
MWTIEDIPDSDFLYYRIHKSFLVNGELIPGAFQERGEGADRGMSTDWSKYSTAEETQQRSKIPVENGIGQFSVEAVRAINLEVTHAPILENRSHSHIKGIPHEGQLKTKARLLLKRICTWAIEPAFFN